LGIALLEAIACGLIIISTDCSGSTEVIADGKTGFIVSKSMSLCCRYPEGLGLPYRKVKI